MEGKPASVSALTLAGCLVFPGVLAVEKCAHAQVVPQSVKADVFTFDIPAQPLAAALKHYASVTRQPTLFRSEIVEGRMSAAVRGQYSPEAALRLLLDGSGLTVEKVDSAQGAFVLKSINRLVVAPQTSLAGYPSQLQARVWEALCNDPITAPGEYRSLLRFQVDAAGQVQRPRLLGSTGDSHRDAAMLATLRRLRMDGPPPSEMPQPVTMLIVPREAGAQNVPRCASGAGQP